MSIRDYPGFKYVPLQLAGGDVRDTWNAKFCKGYIVSVEGQFYASHGHKHQYVYNTIYEAMESIKSCAIIDFFDYGE